MPLFNIYILKIYFKTMCFNMSYLLLSKQTKYCIIFSILFPSSISFACLEAIGHFCKRSLWWKQQAVSQICNMPGSATCRLTPPSAAAWRPSCSSSRRRAGWPSRAAWRCCRTRHSASWRTTSGTDTSASPPGTCTQLYCLQKIYLEVFSLGSVDCFSWSHCCEWSRQL